MRGVKRSFPFTASRRTTAPKGHTKYCSFRHMPRECLSWAGFSIHNRPLDPLQHYVAVYIFRYSPTSDGSEFTNYLAQRAIAVQLAASKSPVCSRVLPACQHYSVRYPLETAHKRDHQRNNIISCWCQSDLRTYYQHVLGRII